MLRVEIAEVCHNLNKALCESQGDMSQKPFALAPEWQIKSAIDGVDFHLRNPNAGPEAGHESWMAKKLEEGWVYGEVKDVEKKTHPCLVPFSSLPVGQQSKDFIFRQVVHSLKQFLTA